VVSSGGELGFVVVVVVVRAVELKLPRGSSRSYGS
jgi:hypothetical protein